MTDWRFISGSRHPAGNRSAGRGGVLRSMANRLCLAATPTFMLMALGSYLSGAASGMSCAAMPATQAFSGMTTMYLLMGAFHLTAWLRLLSSRE